MTEINSFASAQPSPPPESGSNRVALRITIVYSLIGAIWIFISDFLLLDAVQDVDQLSNFQSYKGLAFVFGTSLLLYLLINQMTADLEASQVRLQKAYDATLTGLVHAIELRDVDTQGHANRVTQLATQLARLHGLSADSMGDFTRGALLHDIGKIAIPDRILYKPSGLTNEEWEVMRSHTQRGYELVSSIDYLKNAAIIPLCHHERWDGSGYPQALRGDQIPLEARIFAVVDVWDALTSDRPYRSAWSNEKAIDYIVENSGTLFDPAVVSSFQTMVRELRPATA